MAILTSRIQEALNDQINGEIYAAHRYLSMASYFESLSLRGFAHWAKVQHQEETSHAMKLFDFVNDRNGRVLLQSVPQPPVQFDSVLDVMQQALDHEQKVTGAINHLYEVAHQEKDYASHVLLEWFLEEQVEEERAVSEIVEHLKLIGDDGTGLLMLDSKLSARAISQ